MVNEDKLKELLHDSFDKITFSLENDSKKVNEMSNILNWVVAFLTLFITFVSKDFESSYCCLLPLICLYKCIFVLVVILMIVYKCFLHKYTDTLYKLGNEYQTHYLELKSNLHMIFGKIKSNDESFPVFNVKFRKLEFMPQYEVEKRISKKTRKDEMLDEDRKVNRYGKRLRALFHTMLFLFIIDAAIACILLFIP